MKPTAYLINTARGPVVEERALVEALRAGRIAGAGLDVYEEEPRLAPGLAELRNAVLFPHIGSSTLEAREGMARLAAENIRAALEGRRPPNVVNPEGLTA
jgi:glyoxylate reductase